MSHTDQKYCAATNEVNIKLFQNLLLADSDSKKELYCYAKIFFLI